MFLFFYNQKQVVHGVILEYLARQQDDRLNNAIILFSRQHNIELTKKKNYFKWLRVIGNKSDTHPKQ